MWDFHEIGGTHLPIFKNFQVMLWMQFLSQDPVVSYSSCSQKLRRPDRPCLHGGDFPAKAWVFLASREAGAAPQVSEDAAASVRGLKHNVSGLTSGFSYNNGTLSGFLCGQTFLY